jgi:hypothetical protein
MVANRYACNICQLLIETNLDGGINGITLSMTGPCTNPSELMFVEDRPSSGPVHICGRCCLGLHRAIADLKLMQFMAVQR